MATAIGPMMWQSLPRKRLPASAESTARKVLYFRSAALEDLVFYVYGACDILIAGIYGACAMKLSVFHSAASFTHSYGRGLSRAFVYSAASAL